MQQLFIRAVQGYSDQEKDSIVLELYQDDQIGGGDAQGPHEERPVEVKHRTRDLGIQMVQLAAEEKQLEGRGS